jgi:hypothetical protein
MLVIRNAKTNILIKFIRNSTRLFAAFSLAMLVASAATAEVTALGAPVVTPAAQVVQK